MTRTAVSMAAGAAATIALAWLLAIVVATPIGAASRPSGVGDGWSYWVGRSFGTVAVMRVRAWFMVVEPLRSDYLAVREREVPRWSVVHEPPSDSEAVGKTWIEEARGWPMHAMRSERVIEHVQQRGVAGGAAVGQGGARPEIRVHWGIELAAMNAGRPWGIVLPLRVIWFGFMVDTLVFTGLFFALVFGPGLVRTVYRRAAGRCEFCGYDLRGLARDGECPECGAAVGSVHG